MNFTFTLQDLNYVIYGLGILALLKISLKTLKCVLGTTLKLLFKSSKKPLNYYGKWAVITGATDGIGKEYANQLAAKGLNVVLISRTQKTLDDVAAEFKAKYPSIEIKVIAADFSQGEALYEHLEKNLAGLDIGILVNNVGISYAHPDYFTELENKFLWNLVDINIVSCLMMTKIVLPGMVQRKKGAVINVSSYAGRIPMGLLSAYSASKAFVDFFTQGLEQEYGSKGIVFQSLQPLLVATKLSKIRKSSMFIPSPKDFVRSALSELGGQTRTTGYWSHRFQDRVLHFLPESWRLSYLFSMHQSIRTRALGKPKTK